jgi:hypothetical protein
LGSVLSGYQPVSGSRAKFNLVNEVANPRNFGIRRSGHRSRLPRCAGTSYRADAEDLSGLPVVTKDCGNSVLEFAFGTVPTNSNRVCGVPQPSAFQKLERHFLEFSGDIGSYSFLPRFWRVPDMGLTVAQIFAQKQAYAAQ